MEPEVQVLRKFSPKLVTATQDTINVIVDECLANQLISEEASSYILSQTTNRNKAAKLLKAVTNCVRNDTHCYEVFETILYRELPTQTVGRVFESMKRHLEQLRKERHAANEYTDSPGRSPRSRVTDKSVLTPCRVSIVPFSVTRSKILHRDEQRNCLSAGEIVTLKGHAPSPAHRPDNVNLAIQQVSKWQNTNMCRQPLLSSQRAIKGIIKHAQNALLDAQKDEAVFRKVCFERETLRRQCEQLKNALDEEKQLKQKLESEHDHLNALVNEKEKHKTELKSELDTLRVRMSEREAKERENAHYWIKVESDYKHQVAMHEREIERLTKTLNEQKAKIENIDNSLRLKEREVKELSQQKDELLTKNFSLQRSASEVKFLLAFVVILVVFVAFCIIVFFMLK